MGPQSSLQEIDLGVELARISSRGFIPATATGDGAVGDTLESLLGLPRSNGSGVPDLSYRSTPTELKAGRASSSAQTTLFSCLPSRRSLTIRQLVRSYGVKTADYVRGLFIEVSTAGGNQLGFRLRVTTDPPAVGLIAPGHMPVWWWTRDDLGAKIARQLVVVRADSKRVNGRESFHYRSAVLYRELDRDRFLQAIAKNRIVINLRARYRRDFSDWKDHGTVFRLADPTALTHCYRATETLL